MKSRSSSVISFVFCLVFSISLVVSSISPAWAADTDQYYMDLYFAPPSIDPIMKSERCAVNSRYSVLAYSWTPNSTFSARVKVVSSTFEPVDHVRYLYLTYGIRSTVSGSVTYSTDNNFYSDLSYCKDYQATQYTSSSAVNFKNVQPQYNANARIFTVKVTIPAHASSFSFYPSWVWNGTSSSATYGIYCESAFIVDASEDVVALIDDILDQCIAMNTELDTQTQLLNAIVSSLDSIDSNVSSIYDLLYAALSEEGAALDNQSQQVADQIMQQDNAEQYWQDTNQRNFDALSFDNFTFADGILNALSSVGAVFSSLWSALGDTVLIYTFPLMLGIALVAIGRLSRHAGKGKSGKGKSDGE